MRRVKEFFSRRLLTPIERQLRQGANPRGLALTCAAGTVLAIFPILGSTTALCVLMGMVLKLNQPILQAVNYLLYPVQLLLIPFFLSAGSKIMGSQKIIFEPKLMAKEFANSPGVFLQHYGEAGLYGILVWCLVAPVIAFIIYQISFRIFEKWRPA